jgi:hypothetical protein
VLEGSVAYAHESDVSMAYCDVFDNDDPSFFGMVNPIDLYGNIASDPRFADVTNTDPLLWDLHATAGSPLVDAGDPAILDVDGTTSDIGPFGGPLGSSW